MSARTSNFQFQHKKGLLTYPQMNIENNTAQYVGEHFKWTFQKVMEFTYICCAKEKHQDGNEHYHIYFELRTAFYTRDERFFDFMFNGNKFHPNIEFVKRTPWKTVEYVMKDGDYWEYLPENRPVCSFNQMSKTEKNKYLRRNDPLILYENDQLSPIQCANLLKAKELIERFKLINVHKRDKPVVLWFYGATGTGKTRTAIEIATESGLGYWISHSEKLQWFDGYKGQEYAIIDDFRRNMCSYNYFLRLLDRYSMQVQVKGGYVNWIPKVIIITSPVDVDTAYTYFDMKDQEEKLWDHLDQLKRRIDDEICFD